MLHTVSPLFVLPNKMFDGFTRFASFVSIFFRLFVGIVAVAENFK